MLTIYQIIQAAKDGDSSFSREHLLAEFKGNMVLDIINSPANANEAERLKDEDFDRMLTDILDMFKKPSGNEDRDMAVRNIVDFLASKILCLYQDDKLQVVESIYGGSHEKLWKSIKNIIPYDADNYNHSLMLDIKSLIVGGGKLLASMDDGLFESCNETFNKLYAPEPASINEDSAIPTPPPPPPPPPPTILPPNLPQIIENDEKKEKFSNVLEQLRSAQLKKKKDIQGAIDKLESKKNDAISTVNSSKSLLDQFKEERAAIKNKKNGINSNAPVESKEIRSLKVHIAMGKNRVNFAEAEIAKISTVIENIKSAIKEMEDNIGRTEKRLNQKESAGDKKKDIQELKDTKEMVENSLRKEKDKLIEAERKKGKEEKELEKAKKSLNTLEDKLDAAVEASNLSTPEESLSVKL